jgi:hypothetical protein
MSGGVKVLVAVVVLVLALPLLVGLVSVVFGTPSVPDYLHGASWKSEAVSEATLNFKDDVDGPVLAKVPVSVFQAPTGTEEVVAFYRDAFDRNGWTRRNEKAFAGGAQVLVYQKGWAGAIVYWGTDPSEPFTTVAVGMVKAARFSSFLSTSKMSGHWIELQIRY